MSRLKTIERALESYGYFCDFRPKDKEIPEDLLLVNLDEDRQVTVRVSDSPLDAEDPDGPREYFIHLYTILPIPFIQEHAGELARMLLLYNKGFDFGGFGLSEVDGHIYYQYNFHSSKRVLPTRMLVAIVGLIHMALDSLTAQIHAVATGQASVQEILKASLSFEMPPEEDAT